MRSPAAGMAKAAVVGSRTSNAAAAAMAVAAATAVVAEANRRFVVAVAAVAVVAVTAAVGDAEQAFRGGGGHGHDGGFAAPQMPRQHGGGGERFASQGQQRQQFRPQRQAENRGFQRAAVPNAAAGTEPRCPAAAGPQAGAESRL